MELNESTFNRTSLPPPPPPVSSFDPDALTRALRIAGAILVVASASTFMLQHWQGGNDMGRYAMLVGQSLLLAAAAYFVGLSLREGRSARTFLALVLATMPVSFAVLGGLIYSQFHLEKLALLPKYATWIAPSPQAALLALAGTLIVLVPLGVVSFVALARKEAKALSLAFFMASLLMLLPVRQPVVVMVIAGLALLGLLQLEMARFAGRAQLDTLEGKLARAMPFAAPVIMIGRVFHLYHGGGAFVGGVFLIAAACIWLLLSQVVNGTKRNLGAWLAAACAVVGWALCWTELRHGAGSDTFRVLLAGLPAALLVGVASLRASTSRAALLSISTVLGLTTAILACLVDFDTIAGLCCIALGVAVAVWGASVRALVRTTSGSLVATFGLAVQVWLAVQHDSALRWIGLSAVGMLLIVGSAYVERNRGRIVSFWQEASARRLREQASV